MGDLVQDRKREISVSLCKSWSMKTSHRVCRPSYKSMSTGHSTYLGSSLGVKSPKFLEAWVPKVSRTFLFIRANLNEEINVLLEIKNSHTRQNVFTFCHLYTPALCQPQ